MRINRKRKPDIRILSCLNYATTGTIQCIGYSLLLMTLIPPFWQMKKVTFWRKLLFRDMLNAKVRMKQYHSTRATVHSDGAVYTCPDNRKDSREGYLHPLKQQPPTRCLPHTSGGN